MNFNFKKLKLFTNNFLFFIFLSFSFMKINFKSHKVFALGKTKFFSNSIFIFEKTKGVIASVMIEKQKKINEKKIIEYIEQKRISQKRLFQHKKEELQKRREKFLFHIIMSPKIE
ncbi:MAG: putative secreted protein [Candidatus Phytoplasma cynodontis]|uniref:hypothetical protein n=1 Tax='Cynodon dactylon' phytoplasma TaxID=295320 RepID=UPI001265BCAF|nr:hypothetical protein ['Cynodon dactylon' phytoplasma]KAB8121755.1 hypothetical protein F1741_01800 ['Cynodon dactylon' phytoplasma]WIA07750.1 MAG: putative secreted protein [Candidatus Phytoplasma cynodontis]